VPRREKKGLQKKSKKKETTCRGSSLGERFLEAGCRGPGRFEVVSRKVQEKRFFRDR